MDLACLKTFPKALEQTVSMDNYTSASHNFFTACGVDRASDRRRDEEWLAVQLQDKATRFVPVWKLYNLFTTGPIPKPILLSPREAQDLIPTAESTVLLGVKEGSTYLALGLSSRQASPPACLAELGSFQDLRQVAPLLDELDGTLLAHARAMTYWHCRHRFCGDCGSPTMSLEGGYLRVCTNSQCGQQHFPRTDPAIIVLVTLGERGLLGRKPSWPASRYSTIAGFVEPGESLEDAVIREVREETGVKVEAVHYHSSQPWPFPSSLMLGFTAIASNGTIRVDYEELENARWFTREQIKSEMQSGRFKLPSQVSISYRLIEGWFDAGNLGSLRSIPTPG